MLLHTGEHIHLVEKSNELLGQVVAYELSGKESIEN